MRKRNSHSWGSIYNNALARGYDHGYAAFIADQWEARQKKGEQDAEEKEK